MELCYGVSIQETQSTIMEILTHQYSGFGFGQLVEDSTIGGKRIPKGYVNATAMCKANGKLLGSWNRLGGSKRYVSALAGSMQIHIDQLVIGNESEGINIERGTWVHPEVAIEIARWISPEFNVWANRVIRLVLADQFTPKTADAAIAQQQLKQQHTRILDVPDPWEALFEKKFCDRVFNWFGAGFYWTYAYCELTAEERCKIDRLNPPVGGVRPIKIHQYLNKEERDRMKPFLYVLLGLVNGAQTRCDFELGYAYQFGGNKQLRLWK